MAEDKEKNSGAACEKNAMWILFHAWNPGNRIVWIVFAAARPLARYSVIVPGR